MIQKILTQKWYFTVIYSNEIKVMNMETRESTIMSVELITEFHGGYCHAIQLSTQMAQDDLQQEASCLMSPCFPVFD